MIEESSWNAIPVNKSQLVIGINKKVYQQIGSNYHVQSIDHDYAENHRLWRLVSDDYKESIQGGCAAVDGTVAYWLGDKW